MEFKIKKCLSNIYSNPDRKIIIIFTDIFGKIVFKKNSNSTGIYDVKYPCPSTLVVAEALNNWKVS